jgi:myo-inositol 2-dehydrogenase/D-chiro-inositol 1-dehydrogenase
VENDLNDASMVFTAERVVCERPQWFYPERYRQAYIDETISFIDAVIDDKDVLATGNDGLMPVYIAIAAGKSLRENRFVKLSEVVERQR